MPVWLFNLLEQIINLIISLSYTFLIFMLLQNFLPLRSQNKWFVLLVYLVSTTCTSPTIYPEELTGTMVTLLGFALFMLAFFKGTVLERLSVCIVLYPAMASLHFLTEDIGFQIWQAYPDISYTAQTVLHSFTLLLRLPAWYLVWWFAKKWIGSTNELTARMWIVIDIICMASGIALITFIYYAPMNTAYTIYPAIFACFLTSMGCIYLTAYVAKTIKNEMEIQNLKYQQSYYEELEHNQAAVRKIRHDMNNHLHVAASFLHNHKVKEAEKYLTDLSGELVSGNRIFCKNPIVNAVLNSKYNQAAAKQIDCFFNISIDGMLGIDDISLCSLFSNTLDNALEACQQITETGKRHISVKARYQNGTLYYEINNSKVNEIVVKRGRFLTGKKDKSAHGIGIKNVKDLVEKYDGNIHIDYTKEDFTVTAIIPSC